MVNLYRIWRYCSFLVYTNITGKGTWFLKANDKKWYLQCSGLSVARLRFHSSLLSCAWDERKEVRTTPAQIHKRSGIERHGRVILPGTPPAVTLDPYRATHLWSAIFLCERIFAPQGRAVYPKTCVLTFNAIKKYEELRTDCVFIRPNLKYEP